MEIQGGSSFSRSEAMMVRRRLAHATRSAARRMRGVRQRRDAWDAASAAKEDAFTMRSRRAGEIET
jgi:hypothetical protein